MPTADQVRGDTPAEDRVSAEYDDSQGSTGRHPLILRSSTIAVFGADADPDGLLTIA
ncbi:hypothetical protein [Mycolicibacterium komossense]|uniref:Uncharacterized protein n=1 Tax=Mycolicibacterium komossense TaxID=1779 RepID=A0ABT3CIS4_9MYCO|nr:hypothetical protein [Mycolicibacterium komossense]MCV7229395.1 hypothetical protein [Mycolicibacterium komossense]